MQRFVLAAVAACVLFAAGLVPQRAQAMPLSIPLAVAAADASVPAASRLRMSADLALRPIRLRLARGLLLDALPVLRRRVAASPVAPWELLRSTL